MKKFLVCLLVLSLFSGLAFAAPAKKPEAKLDITTVTAEYSMANFPGELIPGSLLGTTVFVSDYAKFPNIAMFEYIYGFAFGVLSMKTEIGQVGISIRPMPFTYLRDIWLDTDYIPGNVLGLHWAGKIKDISTGAVVHYGTQRHNENMLDVSADDPDITCESGQYFDARFGANIGGIDLSAGLVLNSSYSSYEDWDDIDDWNYLNTEDYSKMVIDIAARMNIAADITGYAKLSWITGSQKDIENYYWYSSPYISEYYNSKLRLEAAAGKVINAGESLKIRLALGVDIDGNIDARYKGYDLYDPGYVYYGYYDQDSMWWIQLPLNVAVQGRISETWSFNTGVRAVLVRLEGEKDAANTADYVEKIMELGEYGDFYVDPELEFAIGLTGVIGNLEIDMFLNPSLFMEGPYFLGGSGAGSFNSGIAFRYKW